MAKAGETSPEARTAVEILNTVTDAPNRWVDEVTHETETPYTRQLHLSELLIGHQDSGTDFYDTVVESVKNLPEEMKPDIIVAGAFLQGDFKHTQKPRRVTLEHGYDSMDLQFSQARKKIDQLLEIAPVIYNMGPDDHRIAYDYTVEVFRHMQNLAKDVGFASQDKMRAHPQWQAHLDFQNRVIFPYCLHAGRRLSSIDEYYKLWGAYHGGSIEGLDIDALNGKDFLVTDDFNLTTTTSGKTYVDKVRSYLGFSPEPQYQDPLKAASQYLENNLANDGENPSALVLQHNHEFLASSYGETWLMSTGALFEPRNFIDTRGHKADARGDISRRLNTTRRRVHAPMAQMMERRDDGTVVITIMNDVLMEKSDSLERTQVLFTCDHQIGSITARPDILLKEIDIFRQRIARTGHAAIQFAGDMSHGRNYPDFPSESQSTGLMAMDSQLRFNERLWRGAFSDMTREDWDKVSSILIQPGNHEWNSGTDKWHGYSFVDNHRLAFELMLARSGMSDKEIREKVKTHDAVTTPTGEVAKSYTGIEYYGDYGVLNQHFLLAKGGKGQGGGSPIYQAPNYINGLADLAKKIDMFGVGHWHHGACGSFGNKLSWIAPAKAGQSGYEIYRGYRPGIGSLIVHLGGGLPPQLEFISERTLHEHTIEHGEFSRKSLAPLRDDRGFDPFRHGLRMGRKFPKSALQKALLELEQDISQRTDTMGYFK